MMLPFEKRRVKSSYIEMKDGNVVEVGPKEKENESIELECEEDEVEAINQEEDVEEDKPKESWDSNIRKSIPVSDQMCTILFNVFRGIFLAMIVIALIYVFTSVIPNMLRNNKEYMKAKSPTSEFLSQSVSKDIPSFDDVKSTIKKTTDKIEELATGEENKDNPENVEELIASVNKQNQLFEKYYLSISDGAKEVNARITQKEVYRLQLVNFRRNMEKSKEDLEDQRVGFESFGWGGVYQSIINRYENFDEYCGMYTEGDMDRNTIISDTNNYIHKENDYMKEQTLQFKDALNASHVLYEEEKDGTITIKS